MNNSGRALANRVRVRSRAVVLSGAFLATGFLATSPASGLVSPEYPGLRILSSEEVLRDRSALAADGSLYFVDRAGARWRLVTSPFEPEITNTGDGSFHPADAQRALDLLREIPTVFLNTLSVDIYLLPYPRSGSLASSSDGRSIYLSPGVHPYSRATEAAVMAHELGHAVQRRFLPDEARMQWAAYAAIRGIADTTRFHDRATRAFRPHEIFAEDFRVLFGGELAEGDGRVENSALASPCDVPGLREFLLGLALLQAAEPGDGGNGDADHGGSKDLVEDSSRSPDRGVPGKSWVVFPNPARAGEPVFLQPRSHDVGEGNLAVTVFDAAGRLLYRFEASDAAQPIRLAPAGERGENLPAGCYWVRIGSAVGNGPSRTIAFRRVR